MLNIIICCTACLLMIVAVLLIPKLRVGKIKLDTYWLPVALGAVLILCCGQTNVTAIGKTLIADTAVNPLKILVLFLSMTVISVFLDELGFFGYLAACALKHSHGGQKRLFFSLYFVVALLTVFTSNDVIVLSFTPFICYFAKDAKIDPLPYLAAEFVAANTWSMALVIGNPTNIYLATAYGVHFVEYLKVSILPTLAAGTVSLALLWLLFRKKLATPVEHAAEQVVIKDKLSLGMGIAHISVCTVMLAVSSYVGIEMWLIALCSAGSLFVFTLIISACRKQAPRTLGKCLKRAPWQFVPFLLAMFVMTEALSEQGTTAAIGSFIGNDLAVLKYGAISFLGSNLINNIPMSVFLSSMITSANASAGAMYATVIGSNIGAFFTPIGALAGLMWSSILSEHDIKFGYKDFLKLGLTVAIPTLAAALGTLYLVLLI
ncbi:MAG: hypothetical protein J1G04_05460 [Clostridiales bacterium]|nr:hypothetical protein [Clostridiales bacterium]